MGSNTSTGGWVLTHGTAPSHLPAAQLHCSKTLKLLVQTVLNLLIKADTFLPKFTQTLWVISEITKFVPLNERGIQ
jgi:hypothetical protein